MEIVTIELEIRGRSVNLDIPGEDAPPMHALVRDLQMVCISLLALEDPRVDAVLEAFGFRAQYEDTEQGEVVVLFPGGSKV